MSTHQSKSPAEEVAPPSHSNERHDDAVDAHDTQGTEAAQSTSNASAEREDGELDQEPQEEESSQPPLPAEDAPPLPEEAAPADDGWEPVWSAEWQRYYFTNRYTGITQWENPRVPEATQPAEAPENPGPKSTSKLKEEDYIGAAGRYNPAIHGDYDPEADYAVEARKAAEHASGPWPNAAPTGQDYLAGQGTGASGYMEANPQFNKRTGQFVNLALHPTHTPAAHTDDAKSYRQQNAFFDVDRAANSHEGRSLKEERRNQKLSKKELKAFQEKRREKKEKKRMAWLKE